MSWNCTAHKQGPVLVVVVSSRDGERCPLWLCCRASVCVRAHLPSIRLARLDAGGVSSSRGRESKKRGAAMVHGWVSLSAVGKGPGILGAVLGPGLCCAGIPVPRASLGGWQRGAEVPGQRAGAW